MRMTAHVTQLFRAMVIYFDHSGGVTDSELGRLLNVKRATACRYRHQLNQLVPFGVYKAGPKRYSMRPADAMVSVALTVLKRDKLERKKLKKAEQGKD
jgi:hypothetical protein